MGLRLLSGLKVLEVGETVAAAYCGKLLVDLGAEVLAVEPPGGSVLRRLPPYYQDKPGPDRSVLHNWLSANKRSIALDIGAERGKAILRGLARGSDVLVEGPMEDGSLGVGPSYEDLKAVNPNLTVVCITPFGRTGPYAAYRSRDLTVFAMSGVSFQMACPVEDPAATPPRQYPGYQAGLVAGLTAANATLWAAAAGKRNGEGVVVDVSEQEALTKLLFEQIGYLSDGTLALNRKMQLSSGTVVAGGLVWCLPCSDGWVMISPREDHQFKRWSEVMGSPEWASREEFSTAKLREQHAWEVFEHSATWTRRHKKLEVFQAAQESKVPCFPVSLISDLPEMPQLEHRSFWTEIEHPVIKDLQYPGLPMKTDSETAPTRPAPAIGEHTLEILDELGVSQGEIKSLWKLGVI